MRHVYAAATGVVHMTATVHDQYILDNAFDQAPDAMIIVDASERILRINRQFTKLTGYQPDDIVGRKPSLLRSDRNRPDLFGEFWTSLANAGRWRGEIHNRKKNGRLFIAELTVSAVTNRHGKVDHYIGVYRDITALKNLEHKQEMQENRERQTFLLHRRAYLQRLADFAARPAVGGCRAVLLVNLDKFRTINDRYGLDAADAILMEAAQRLKRCLRQDDLIARLDGNEFAITLTDLNDPSDIPVVTAKILNKLRQAYDIGAEAPVFVPCSIGAVSLPDLGVDCDTIFRRVHQALDAAKAEGGGGYRILEFGHKTPATHRSIQEAALSA